MRGRTNNTIFHYAKFYVVLDTPREAVMLSVLVTRLAQIYKPALTSDRLTAALNSYQKICFLEKVEH